MTAFPKYASGLSENSMRVSENPTATATLRVARDETDNAQLRSKKTSPDLNYTAESKSLQISKERLIVQENPGSTNRLHRRVPRPRLCFRTTRFSPITPNQQDSPILQGGCSADPEATPRVDTHRSTSYREHQGVITSNYLSSYIHSTKRTTTQPKRTKATT